MVIMAIVATIPAIMSLYKIKNEINTQRIENIFAKPVSRTYYFSGFIVISLINAVMMIFLASLGMYIAQASVLDNPFTFWTMIKSGIVYIPAIITFVGIGVLLIGWLNKGHFIVYLYLGYTFFVVYLGQLLDVKEWLKNLTPFQHIPEIPVDKMDYMGISVLIVISIIMIIVGLIGFRRKDIS